MKILAYILLSALLITAPAYSQFEFLKKKAKEKVEKEIEKGIEGSNESEEMKEEESDSKKAEEPKEKEKSTELSLQSYSKYDFVPGEKIIFFEDFSQDAIGDFPAQWNTNGSAEVVTNSLYPGKWMQFISDESVWTDNLLNLPDNYTIEFDIVPIKGHEGNMSGYTFRLIQAINAKAFDHGSVPGRSGFAFVIEYYGTPRYRTYINEEEGYNLALSGSKDGDQFKQKVNQKYHIAIWVQKARIRLYQDEVKMFDLPKAFPLPSVKMDRIRFEYGAAMVSNIRIAVGAPDMRNKLLTEGKLVSYGLYFDVNKDVLKPESYATLKGIADVLTENPSLRIKIVGHTDSDGADAENMTLSKRRGEAVKNELVKTFSIDASRIEADGLGETQPVAPNDTPANKALNRRVEFIKL